MMRRRMLMKTDKVELVEEMIEPLKTYFAWLTDRHGQLTDGQSSSLCLHMVSLIGRCSIIVNWNGGCYFMRLNSLSLSSSLDKTVQVVPWRANKLSTEQWLMEMEDGTTLLLMFLFRQNTSLDHLNHLSSDSSFSLVIAFNRAVFHTEVQFSMEKVRRFFSLVTRTNRQFFGDNYPWSNVMEYGISAKDY